MLPEDLKQNITVYGPLFPEPVQIIMAVPMGTSVKLIGKGARSIPISRFRLPAWTGYAREELAKAGHPEPPHPHGPIDFGTTLGIAKKSLPTPDEVARSETEKTNRDGPKRRTSET